MLLLKEKGLRVKQAAHSSISPPDMAKFQNPQTECSEGIES